MDYSLGGEFNIKPESMQKLLESNILMYCVVLLLVLKIITIGISLNLPFNIFFADIAKVTLENLANQTRQSLGLGILVDSPKLDEAAQLKAEDMVKNGYFGHTSPSGITPWFWFLKTGYDYKYAGENLAIGFYDSAEVYNAWLNSPSHKENLLNPNYKEVGTAIIQGFGENKAIIVVQLFGSSKPAVAAPAKNTAVKTMPAQAAGTSKPADIQEENGVPAEKVLSQSAEAEIKPLENIAKNNAFLELANYVVYNYNELMQNIIYGVSFVVIGALLSLIFFSFDFEIGKVVS